MRVVGMTCMAGGPLVGARSRGLEVEQSLESYPQHPPVLQANGFRACLPPWPDLDLRGKLVLAQPPCSPFSATTKGKAGHGDRAAAFGCTTEILQYALPRRPELLLVESVAGAIAGAGEVHRRHAAAYGYNLFRVLCDAQRCGVPQVRVRSWTIYSKRPVIALERGERTAPLSDALVGGEPLFEAALRRQYEALLAHKLPARQVLLGKHGLGNVNSILRRMLGRSDRNATRGIAVPWFDTSAWRVCDAARPTGVLLSGTHLCVPDEGREMGARSLSAAEHKRLMGFPEAYDLGSPSQLRTRLSQGVPPPVAAWLISGLLSPGGRVCRPGEVLDLT